jgi:hypothetical protein
VGGSKQVLIERIMEYEQRALKEKDRRKGNENLDLDDQVVQEVCPPSRANPDFLEGLHFHTARGPATQLVA